MRNFGPPIGPEQDHAIRQLAHQVFEAAPARRAAPGGDFAMDERADQTVLYEADIRLADGQRLRVAETIAEARPPFEWLMEITSDIGEADYFKHYLVREHDIVLAQRKELIPIDAAEAELILHDLGVAQAAIATGNLKIPRQRRRTAS